MVICDEGHILKNEQTAMSKAVNKIHTRRRVILTGTPLQNNLIECWCLCGVYVVFGGVYVVFGGVYVVFGGVWWCFVLFGGVWWCLVVFGGVYVVFDGV